MYMKMKQANMAYLRGSPDLDNNGNRYYDYFLFSD